MTSSGAWTSRDTSVQVIDRDWQLISACGLVVSRKEIAVAKRTVCDENYESGVVAGSTGEGLLYKSVTSVQICKQLPSPGTKYSLSTWSMVQKRVCCSILWNPLYGYLFTMVSVHSQTGVAFSFGEDLYFSWS